ncbi:MAG: hypothetical protein ACM3O7_01785 [Acidobacteriota bacterium]
MRRVLMLLVGVLGLASVAVASGATQAQSRWVITDLGTLGALGPLSARESHAVDINDRGQIVGDADARARSGNQIWHAFLWQNGKMHDLGAVPGKPRSHAVGVNERGQVLVVAQAATEDKDGWTPSRAYLWESGKTRDLGTPSGKSSVGLAINERGQIIGCVGRVGGYPDSCFTGRSFAWERGRTTYLGTLGGAAAEAVAINDHGQVVGAAGHAFLWEGGRLRDLGTLGGKKSGATGISESGQIIGWSETGAINRVRDDYDRYGAPISRAFLWQRGKLRDLGAFGGPDSQAVAVNRLGQVVGWAETRTMAGADRHIGDTCGDMKYSHPAPHAFLWAKGQLVNLGSLGGLESEAAAVNAKGQVVGWADTRAKDASDCPVGHAFLWEKGKMTDLGTLRGGKQSEAVAINDHGQVIGWSETASGAKHAVLWTLTR